jgi:hypothetical protein
MADDLGMTDSQSTRMFNVMNAFDFQGFNEVNCGLATISTVSNPNGVGSRLLQSPSPSLWTQSPLFGTSGTHGDTQVRAPGYLDSNGIETSAFKIASGDTSESLHFGDYGFIAANSFERPTMTANDAFLPTAAQTFGNINHTVGPTGPDSAAPICLITQHVNPSVLKKRKTSTLPESVEPAKDVKVFDRFDVLNLLFKYTQDLTMTQMLNIAEDTGYTPEFVVNSYLQYRKEAKSSSRLLDRTSSIAHPPISSTTESNGDLVLDSRNGGQKEDSNGSNDASKDIRQEELQDDDLMGSLEHAAQCKPLQCPVPDCNTRFSRQGELKRHAKKHQPGEFACTFPSCGRVFYRKDKLRQHWEKEHGDSSRPPNLSSSRPRRGPDQDGNSRSNGFSRAEESETSGAPSDPSSEGRNSNTSSSSTQDRASDDQDVSSESPGRNCEVAGDLPRVTLPSKEPHQPAAGELTQQVPTVSTSESNELNLDQNKTEIPRVALKDDHMRSSREAYEESIASSVSDSPSILSKPVSLSSTESDNILEPRQLPKGTSLHAEFATMSIQGQNALPCLLRYITGCPVSFRATEREEWYSHSLSHYGDAGPPTYAVCIFCHKTFASNDPSTCWSNRMHHIADHLKQNWTIESSRPDFRVIEDLWNKGCISEDDYKHCFNYTERPPYDSLRPYDSVPKYFKDRLRAEVMANRVVVAESRAEIRDKDRGKRPAVVSPKDNSEAVKQ